MFFFHITFIITYFGCETDLNPIEYLIEYDPINMEKITSSSWLEIDGVKICHQYKIQSNHECGQLTIPSFNFIEFEIEDKQQISYMNKIEFSIQLYEKLFKENKNYVIKNTNLIYSVGVINFKRRDKKTIDIRYSKGYPLIIKRK